MTVIDFLLLSFLIICALSVALSKNLVATVFIFSSFSLVASILWITMQAPDLAITEAAVGAGASTLFFLLVLRNTGALKGQSDEEDNKK